MRISQGKGGVQKRGVQKRGSPEDLLHLPNRARRDLATTFHRLSKEMAPCEQAPRATKKVRVARPS